MSSLQGSRLSVQSSSFHHAEVQPGPGLHACACDRSLDVASGVGGPIPVGRSLTVPITPRRVQWGLRCVLTLSTGCCEGSGWSTPQAWFVPPAAVLFASPHHVAHTCCLRPAVGHLSDDQKALPCLILANRRMNRSASPPSTPEGTV